MAGTKKELYHDRLLEFEDENIDYQFFVSEVKKVLPDIIGKLSGIDSLFDSVLHLEKLLEKADLL